MPKVTAYIIAYNEVEKVGPALDSVLWADEVLLIDSGSNDGTAELAEKKGARVIQVPFEGFGKLRTSAINACSHEWIFSLDSDERCTGEAKREILEIVNNPESLDAYHTPRRNWFLGRWVKYSGWYPDYRQPQLFKKGAIEFGEEEVHESWELKGRLGYMKSDVLQVPYKDLSQLLQKMDRYTSLGADKLKAKGKSSTLSKAFFHACWSFLKHYVFKRGFLDGWAGFVIALSNFEGTFYRYAKLAEREYKLSKDPTKEERK